MKSYILSLIKIVVLVVAFAPASILASDYSDADDSNFLTNKESYKLEEQKG